MGSPLLSMSLDLENLVAMPLEPLGPTPEQRLMVAIVRRAVWDFVFYKDADPKGDPVKYAIAADAIGWMFWDGAETVDDQGRFTFLHICDSLNLAPQRVRAEVMKLKREDAKRLHNSFKEV